MESRLVCVHRRHRMAMAAGRSRMVRGNALPLLPPAGRAARPSGANGQRL